MTPAPGQKNRQVQILHVITGLHDYEDPLAILMNETITPGMMKVSLQTFCTTVFTEPV